jgi:pimeloyl-ACP methyl ester carboxylesterase
MNDPVGIEAPLPVGFEKFPGGAFVGYQLNRARSLGYTEPEELRRAAATVRSRAQCAEIFEALSRRAEAEGRLRNATSYLRIAEFLTPPASDSKVPIYIRYRRLFDEAFADSGVVRHDVPYGGSTLPAYTLASFERPPKGTVLVHGGFDSLIEEFFAIWQRIAAAGFDVIAFEGPGQGGARALGGLTFDHDWEKPVGAMLDYFKLDSAGLVGISMGGYWALRAAGREPRIDRVVSWPPVYDWLYRVPSAIRGATRLMLRQRGFMNWSVRVRTRLVPTLRQVIDQAMYLVDGREPTDAVDWFLGMNAGHLGSDRVTQDVLVLCGEHDAFQPAVLTRAQVAALTNARSVTVRMFTKAEHADQHCQMGNLELACSVVTGWLTEPRVRLVRPAAGFEPATERGDR